MSGELAVSVENGCVHTEMDRYNGFSMKIQTNCLLGAVNLNRIPDVDAGWSSLVARRAHNPKVVGSNPAPATKLIY